MVWQLHDRCAGTRRKTVSRGWPGPRQTSPRHDPGAAGHPDGQRTTGGATSGATRPPGCRHGCSDTRHKAWQPQGKSQLGQKGRKDRSAGPRVRHRHRAPSHIATAYHRRASAPPHITGAPARHRISSGRQHMTGSPLAGSHSRENWCRIGDWWSGGLTRRQPDRSAGTPARTSVGEVWCGRPMIG